MAKKAQASLKPGLSMPHVLCLGWKLVVLVSIVLCVLTFLRIQQYPQATGSYSSAHLPRKSRVLSYQFSGDLKIAFLFLVRKNLPLDFLWASFFENVEKAKFSIYIHSEPGFVFDESNTRSAFFLNRQLNNSIKVAWGEASMIEAERVLFEEALQDPANQRFILLSDSCVPLYNFSYIYKYLMDSPRSFVDSFFDKKDVRYNPKMSPVIHRNKWRKGSQVIFFNDDFALWPDEWIDIKPATVLLTSMKFPKVQFGRYDIWVTLIRRHAEVVVDDETVFPMFRKYCK
ncbi:hypothetical protein OROMI_022520 [Orobanche minor]